MVGDAMTSPVITSPTRRRALTNRTAFHHHLISTPAQFVRTLNAGPFAWPGLYPLYFVTSDGAALSWEAAKAEARQVCAAIRDGDTRGGWHVMGCEVNYEDAALFCDHTGKRIPSAYAEDEAARV